MRTLIKEIKHDLEVQIYTIKQLLFEQKITNKRGKWQRYIESELTIAFGTRNITINNQGIC